MHKPPHPGEFIQATYMKPFGLSCRYLAEQLNVAASTLNHILKAQSAVSPEMALRLSKALGRSPESMACHARCLQSLAGKKTVKLGNVHKIKLNAA